MKNIERLNMTMGTQTGWSLTDDSCLQFQRQESEKCFDMIQLIWLDTTKEDLGHPDREYIVVAAHIELEEQELENYISGYYDSISDMTNAYNLPLKDLYPLIAECAFENIWDESGYDYTSGMLTKAEAEELILTYVETCNCTLPNRACSRCGHPVFTSFLKDADNEYKYQCMNCNEDLYMFETI